MERLARVAELVDARDLKSLERNLVPVRLRPWAKRMKKIYLIGILIILAGCSPRTFLPIPDIMLPEINERPDRGANYGAYPKDYQKLLQSYLKQNLTNPHDAKIEFVNKPIKMSVTHLNEDAYGYRVCLSIDQKNRSNKYIGFVNHFFLIRDSSIVMHIYDSGLLKIPFDLCIARREDRTILLEEAPIGVTIEEMDDIDLIKPELDQQERMRTKRITDDIYISCVVDENEYTYVFNEDKNTLEQSIGTVSLVFSSVKFSKTHIFGILKEKEILLNRVSGSVYMKEANVETKGSCKVKDERKF